MSYARSDIERLETGELNSGKFNIPDYFSTLVWLDYAYDYLRRSGKKEKAEDILELKGRLMKHYDKIIGMPERILSALESCLESYDDMCLSGESEILDEEYAYAIFERNCIEGILQKASEIDLTKIDKRTKEIDERFRRNIERIRKEYKDDPRFKRPDFLPEEKYWWYLK